MNKPRSQYHRISSACVLALTLFTLSCSANQANGESEKKHGLVVAEEQPKAKPLTTDANSAGTVKVTKMTGEEQILFARQDLAKRLDMALDEVKLSGAVNVTWRSGALGCPKPGMQYTQALVKGVLIMLKVGNTAYRYHAIPRGEPFHCPDGQAEPPYVNTGDA